MCTKQEGGKAKSFLREVVPVLIGFIPALDAYHVAKSAKHEAGKSFGPLVELT